MKSQADEGWQVGHGRVSARMLESQPGTLVCTTGVYVKARGGTTTHGAGHGSLAGAPGEGGSVKCKGQSRRGQAATGEEQGMEGLPSWPPPPGPIRKCLPGDTPAHLLVLAQRLLLAGQARSLLCIRLVRGGDLVGLGPRPAAHLTAGPCGLIDEGTARALPAHLGTEER